MPPSGSLAQVFDLSTLEPVTRATVGIATWGPPVDQTPQAGDRRGVHGLSLLGSEQKNVALQTAIAKAVAESRHPIGDRDQGLSAVQGEDKRD